MGSIPQWEKTRTFPREKRQPNALPTVHASGVVHSTSNRDRFVLTSNLRSDSKAREDPEGNAEEKIRGHPTEQDSHVKDRDRIASASFKALRKRTRKDLEKYAREQDSLEETKTAIAAIASMIIGNPQEKVGLLKKLREMVVRCKGQASALALLTETQIYKDIAPAYKIRRVSEKEAETKVSKEVAALRRFEETLLESYSRFVRSCVSVSKWRTSASVQTQSGHDTERVRVAACTALAELISALPHFNESEVVADAVCGNVCDRDPRIRLCSSEALQVVLGDAHRASGFTLQICTRITKNLAKCASGKLREAPREVVIPLTFIQFVKFPRLPISRAGKNDPKKAKRFIKKKRRKTTPEEVAEETELEKDLKEADAEASPQELYYARKNLLDSVCHAYFNVIHASASNLEGTLVEDDTKSARTRRPPDALPVALKGLLRVSTFISTDVVEAILAALILLLEKGRLPLGVRFRCLSASYAVLAVHAKGQKANLDSFTGDARALDTSLYAALRLLFSAETPVKDEESVCFDAVEAVLAAASFRDFPSSRSSAFARRLAILAASASPNHACTIGLLGASQLMLSSELTSPIFAHTRGSQDAGHGDETGLIQSFDMTSPDPDIASAERSAAWEMSCLRSHYHPFVRKVAIQCTNGHSGTRLPGHSENVVMIARRHSCAEGGFNPTPKEELDGRCSVGRKTKRVTFLKDGVLQRYIPDDVERNCFLGADEECELASFKCNGP